MPYFVSDKILRKFQGKDIENIFEQAKIVSNELGDFLCIKNAFERLEPSYTLNPKELKIFRYFTEQKLSLVKGISQKKMEVFKKKKLNHISELVGLGYQQYYNVEILDNSISCKDYESMMQNSNVRVGDLLFCVEPEEILFLDIETTGQHSAELFLIGVGYFVKDNRGKYSFETDLLFARELADEVSVLKHFVDMLPRFRMFVTYNGRMFDIPFIRNRICTLLDSEDISDVFSHFVPEDNDDLFLVEDMIDSILDNFIHFDLYFEIRRTYKDLLPNYRLVTAEEDILGFFREDYLPSEDIPMIYIDWVAEPKKYAGAIFKVLQHNYWDILNLAKLLKEWINMNVVSIYNQTINLKEKTEEQTIQSKLGELKEKNVIEKLEDYFNRLKKSKAKTLDDFF